MQVVALLLFCLLGMGVVAALAAALYASLPRNFLDCAERHGRFRGLRQDAPSCNGTATEIAPRAVLMDQVVSATRGRP